MNLDLFRPLMKRAQVCRICGISRWTFARHRPAMLRAGVRFTQVNPGPRGERIIRDSLSAYLQKMESKHMKRLTPNWEAIHDGLSTQR